MSNKKDICKEIEITREELHILAIERKFDFQDQGIQKLSTKLDTLINKYMLHEKRKKKNMHFF